MAELPLPDPPLMSDSIALRAWTAADLPAVVAACQDPLIERFCPAIPYPYAEAEARDWLESQEPARRAGASVAMAVVGAGGEDLRGSISVAVEAEHGRGVIGYWTAPAARGRGVMTTAVRLLSRWALDELGLARLEMFIEPENLASQRVAERCGYTREGLLRSRWLYRGQRRDSLIYGLLRGELR